MRRTMSMGRSRYGHASWAAGMPGSPPAAPERPTSAAIAALALIKRRRCLNIVRAICRLRVLIRPKLQTYELLMLARMFQEAGSMRTVQQVSEVLSAAGVGVGVAETEQFLLDHAWYKPGRVLEWRQFVLLCKYLKRRFRQEQQVPDSHVAFVALGGEHDLGGIVSADDLRTVCQNFRLTIDIEAFIAEHDDDGSGCLEFDEFSALFAEAAANHGRAVVPSTSLPGTAEGGVRPTIIVATPPKKEDKKEASADPAAAAESLNLSASMHALQSALQQAHLPPKAASQAQQESDDVTVLDGVDGWLKSTPPIPDLPPDYHTMRLRRRRTQASARRQAREAAQRGDTPLAPHRRQLWESGKEDAARGALESRLRERCPSQPADGSPRRRVPPSIVTTFGAAPRFNCDVPLAPLPPPRGSSTARGPTRPHFRDGSRLHSGGSSRFPSISAVSSAPGTARRGAPRIDAKWFEYDPFQAAAAEGREKLPLVARDRNGNAAVCQPEMAF